MPQVTEAPPDACAAKLAQVVPVIEIFDCEVPKLIAARMAAGVFGPLVDA